MAEPMTEAAPAAKRNCHSCRFWSKRGCAVMDEETSHTAEQRDAVEHWSEEVVWRADGLPAADADGCPAAEVKVETEAERIRGLIESENANVDEWEGRDGSVAATLERFALPLAEEVDRLRAALSRWGAWCHGPDGMGGELFEAAVEGTPAECFPADSPEAP